MVLVEVLQHHRMRENLDGSMNQGELWICPTLVTTVQDLDVYSFAVFFDFVIMHSSYFEPFLRCVVLWFLFFTYSPPLPSQYLDLLLVKAVT